MSFTRGKALAELAGSPLGVRLWSVRTEQDENHYIAECPVSLQKGRRREPESNARLFAASITAATRAEKMGYNGQAAVEALPELLEALEAAKEAISEAGGHHVYCKYRTAKEDGIMDKVSCNCWNGEAVEAIETVLTKAKGGQP